MIERLTIEGFQAHKRLELALGPITTVVGPTDAGKSAVLRSLRWLSLNRPAGLAHIMRGRKRAKISAVVDGHSISRSRSPSKNRYSLDGRKFQAFGNDVPKEVQEVLLLDDVNFQDQHDPPFWLSLPAGEVARRLNEVVDLSVIDRALGNLAGAARKAKDEKAVVKKRLAAARAGRDELSWTRRCGKHLAEVELLRSQLVEVAGKRSDLELAARNAREAEASRKDAVEAAREAEAAAELGAVWEKRRRARKALESAISETLDAQLSVKAAKEALPMLAEVVAAGERWREKKQKADELERAINLTSREERDLDVLRAGAAKYDKQFHEAMGEECVLCGQKIPS